MTLTPVDQLREAVEAVATDAAATDAPFPKSRPSLERPRQADHGDYATNAAMLLAPVMKAKPRDVADRLVAGLTDRLGASLDRVEVAGPGFLNLFLSDGWYVGALAHVVSAGDTFGAGGAAPSFEKVDVEFVSANPTGPLHVGHARNAAYGDALARLFSFVGHDVTREFYINDFGSQVANFGRSVQARARGEEVPEDGYVGDYVATLALEIADAGTRPVEEVGLEAVAMMVERAKASLHAFRVEFDLWFSEKSLHEVGPDGTSGVSHGFDVLAAQGHTYTSEGALWLRTTDFGDDKDRVIERSTGEHTYFASDIAYAQNKRERGFDRMVYVLGADHHGYIGRMRAAYEALGGEPDRLDLLIMQFVHLVRGGEKVSMSKRAGEFVTLDELVEEIGVDAARWFLLNRSHDTTIEVDLELAKSETSDNPVYYVQYAHARIAAVLRKAGVERVADALAEGFPASGLSLHPSERALIAKLLAWPAEATDAAERRAIHRVAAYALELAQAFSAFYRDCQVVGVEPEELESFRIALSVATQRTIARALDLLGVSAPEEM
jgi:arginyl-tRNA synthetase